MRIFVYEYLSSGAGGRAAGMPSLQREGWAMLSAVLKDLTRCPEVRLSTLLDSRRTVLPPWMNDLDVQRASPDDEEQAFRVLATAADASLVIAPEFDGLLAERSRWVEEADRRLLGSSSAAIDATADKLLLCRRWASRGVPTPSFTASYPLVLKPRFGAGSQATFLIRDESEWKRAERQAEAENGKGERMQQAYQPGLAASVAFLAGPEERIALPAVEQRLSQDGRFRYLGGRLPLPDNLDRRARALAERAVDCVDGLHGWFGVDLVLGNAEDGSEDAVLEINPRLTTSYLGLRRLARFNLAEAMVAVATGSPPSAWEWGCDPLVFDA